MLKALCLTLLFAAATFPQAAKCDLTLAKAPAVRGLALGMTYDAVMKTYPLYSGTRDTIELKGGRPPLDGVRGVKMEFIGDRVSRITVTYDETAPTWASNREFGESVSAALGLPSAWRMEYALISDILPCDGFTVRVSTLDNTLTITDTAAVRAASAARSAAVDEKKKRFKP